jgi:hypothetical protein
MRCVLLSLAIAILGCGDDTGALAMRDLAVADLATTADQSVDCTTAGCAPPPICGQPCGSVCGCCFCSAGDPDCDISGGCIRPHD